MDIQELIATIKEQTTALELLLGDNNLTNNIKELNYNLTMSNKLQSRILADTPMIWDTKK